MPDDPRDILKAAGVECAEVEKVGMSRGWYDAKASHQHALNIIEIDDAAILALARLVAPLARFLNAERALNDPDIAEGTTHCQTDAHIESDKAYRAACAALGLDSFLESSDA